MDVKLCRLCAIKKDSFVGVYDDEGNKLRIESKINKCLQIEVGLGLGDVFKEQTNALLL